LSKQGGIFLFKKRRGQNSVVGGGQFCVDIPTPGSPKVFCITNSEELCVFCLREDFTHIKYCLLKDGKISNGRIRANGNADTVLGRFRESIKGVLRVCLGQVAIEYDENWFPILEKFRVELDNLKDQLSTSLERALRQDNGFRQNFREWAESLFPYYNDRQKKSKISEGVAACMLFKALSYEIIRDLLRNVPLDEINNVRLNPISRVNQQNLIDTLAQLYTDIVRIDYRLLFETDDVEETVNLTNAGKASLNSFVGRSRYAAEKKLK